MNGDTQGASTIPASPLSPHPSPVVRHLGLAPYETVWQAMREFTARRDRTTPDEIWLVQHPPVFTLGQAGKPEHVLDNPGIPVVRSDRGGQVTYHGPGQIIAYVLLDLRRLGINVHGLVRLLEHAVIDLLAANGVAAERRVSAPGVYVGEAKIASLGLKIRQGCSYHGLSLNVDLDPAPFRAINPCGYPGLQVTRTCDLGVPGNAEALGDALARGLIDRLEALRG